MSTPELFGLLSFASLAAAAAARLPFADKAALAPVAFFEVSPTLTTVELFAAELFARGFFAGEILGAEIFGGEPLAITIPLAVLFFTPAALLVAAASFATAACRPAVGTAAACGCELFFLVPSPDAAAASADRRVVPGLACEERINFDEAADLVAEETGEDAGVRELLRADELTGADL